MFQEQLQYLPAKLNDFTPCEPAFNRAFWQQLPPEKQRTLLMRAEPLHGKPFAPITIQDWLLFSKTGNRECYESLYFDRRRQLNDLIMAECVEYKGRFADDIANGIRTLCDEAAWQLPAHNAYKRDAPQLPLPDLSRPVLDLFACETGAQLAVARFLLADVLDGISPLICRRIDSLLDERIIQPYLTDSFWWMGDGDEPMCNWTSWCTQNLLLTVFCSPQTEQTRRAVIRQAAYSLDCFVKDYGDDGCCNEGAQYYSHAALAMWGALEVLAAAAPEAFHPLFSNPKIKNMAAYIFNLHVGGEYYINFADCSPKAGRRGVREFLFAERTGNQAMAAFCANDYRLDAMHERQARDIERINLYYLVLDAVHSAQLDRYPAVKAAHNDIYYPSVGVFITRDDVYCLAVKAGGNGDSHNHNDTGSIILYKNERPLLIDIGVETYTEKTFSPQRYDIWTMQSAWHNLPTFDGAMQQPGAQYCASDVSTRLDDSLGSISMQLAGAWSQQAGLRSFVRTVTLRKGSGLTLHDRCTGSYKQAVLSLLFCEHPILDGCKLHIGQTAVIELRGGSIPAVEPVTLYDERLLQAWPNTLYRVTVGFEDEIEVSVY